VSLAIERLARRVRRTWLREWGLFLALVAPNVRLLAAFTYWPLAYNAYLSLTEWEMIAPEKSFVGLESYRELLRDPRLRASRSWSNSRSCRPASRASSARLWQPGAREPA
jgi:sn-glycerol 3-phosphate transport system permease protein